MNKSFLISAVLLISTAFSQNNISFKFGLPISNAQILLKDKTVLGKTFTPTIRTGYFHLGQSLSSSEQKESIGVHLFIPSVGVRSAFKRPGEATDLRRYWLADVFTAVPIFTGSDKDELADEWDEQFDLVFGLIGGYGVEYFFSKEFSIGGEASMNIITNNWKDEGWSDEDYNSRITEDWRLSAGAVFTQFTLNYYFN